MTGPEPGAAQVSAAVLCNAPATPEAEAVMVTPAPIPTQVAAPVLGLMVAVFVSEEVHCAAMLVWVMGG